MNKNLKYCLLPLILLIILIILLYTDNLLTFDMYVASLIYRSPFLTSFFKIITWFGSTWGIISISLILIFIIRPFKKLLWLYTTIISSTIINNVLKIIICRPRPDLNFLVKETTYSFPSGHAMATLTFYGSLIYLIWQSNLSKGKKVCLTSFLGLLIMLIGYSRIYLNVHHLTDIFAGFLCSIIIINLAIYVDKKLN